MTDLPDEYQEAIREQVMREAEEEDRLPFDETFYRYFAYLIDIDRIPDDVLFSLWGIAHKIHQLTNFNAVDVRIMLRKVDNIFTYIRMSIPEYEYDFVMHNKLEQMELMFYSMIKRSEQGFERRMQATQITQQEHVFRQETREESRRLLERAASWLGYKPKLSR
ncbi:MAG: hypothetical protein J7K38_00730 [Thermoplasmata archaeon]|nr:hypothetical protein [Thermoplasmata archaeon]